MPYLFNEDSKQQGDKYYYLGDNCIQIFNLGRYIVGYFVLRQRVSGAVKRNFRSYIDHIP